MEGRERVTTYKLYDGVELGEGSEIGDFAIIGVPSQSGGGRTRIGAGAVIRSHTVIYAGNVIGRNFQTGHHALVREDNQIGDNVSIGTSSVVEHHVKIGDGVRLHSCVFVPEYSVLENDAWLGPGVIVTNARFPRSAKVKDYLRGPHIGAGARIGAGAVLLPGIRIGEGVLVGAGAIVTKDVPDHAVVVGNPARVTKRVFDLRYDDDASVTPY